MRPGSFDAAQNELRIGRSAQNILRPIIRSVLFARSADRFSEKEPQEYCSPGNRRRLGGETFDTRPVEAWE